MTGTVTGLSGSTLVMDITSKGGACGSNANGQGLSNCRRWQIATPATTTIINNSTSSPLFTIAEDTSVHTAISGIYFAPGTNQSHIIYVEPNAGGTSQAILIHDNRFTANPNNP